LLDEAEGEVAIADAAAVVGTLPGDEKMPDDEIMDSIDETVDEELDEIMDDIVIHDADDDEMVEIKEEV
jgi:fructose 1,6-bisphosphatase